MQEVLDYLGSFLLRHLVDLSQENHQRVQVEELKDGLAVIANASKETVVNLSKALTKVKKLVAVLG